MNVLFHAVKKLLHRVVSFKAIIYIFMVYLISCHATILLSQELEKPAFLNEVRGISKNIFLKSSVVIEGDFIYLKDLFYNLPVQYEDIIYSRAPEPGKKVLLYAPRIFEHIQTYQIPWIPPNNYATVVVNRAAIYITRSEILDLIHETLMEQGLQPLSYLTLPGNALNFPIAPHLKNSLQVSNASYDLQSETFSATIEFGNNSPYYKMISCKGNIVFLVEIPVITRNISRKDIIEINDIAFIQIKKQELRSSTVTHAQDIVGMTTKGFIRSNRAIQKQDITKPLLIKRGDLIIFQNNTRRMSLSLKAKALDSGGLHDIIRIQNLQTKTIVNGQITGPGTAQTTVIRKGN